MTSTDVMSGRVAMSVNLFNFSAEPRDPDGWEHLFELAAIADEVDIDRIVVSDHVVNGEQMAEYSRPEVGGIAGGVQPTGPDGHYLEPLTLLAMLARSTTRVRLATGIVLAALRRPIVFAKVAATIDHLSGGRLDLGVGVGWQRAEYEAAGIDFARRGRFLDHTLEVCQALWQEQSASYRSPELEFGNIHMMPKPTQAGGVPIWVSGRVNAPVMRRLARFGAGWLPWDVRPSDLPAAIRQVRDGVEEHGRDPDEIGIVARLPLVAAGSDGEPQLVPPWMAGGPVQVIDVARTLEPVPGLVEAGATDFRIYFPAGSLDEVRDQLDELIGAFREVTSSTVNEPPTSRRSS